MRRSIFGQSGAAPGLVEGSGSTERHAARHPFKYGASCTRVAWCAAADGLACARWFVCGCVRPSAPLQTIGDRRCTACTVNAQSLRMVRARRQFFRRGTG